MLCDWMTLRTPINDIQDQDIHDLMPYLALETIKSSTDEVIKQRMVIDIDQVRSDFQGFVWSITSNGKQKYLSIGASPAWLEHGRNIFGDLDIEKAKTLLIAKCRQVLPNVLLFRQDFEIRRLDITQNYFMESKTQLKDALHILRACDGIRQKATVAKGDTVYWGSKSALISGKVYDKGSQAIHLCRNASKRNLPMPYTESELHLVENVLRAEMKLGRLFFERLESEDLLTPDFLAQQHDKYFSKFIGSNEVTDMDDLLNNLLALSKTQGQAKAAYGTYLTIKQIGLETTKNSMSRRTFQRHKKLLHEAGLSQSDLTTATIIPLRKRRIDLVTVDTWEELRQLQSRIAA